MSKQNFCPLINKKCVEHKCAWYIQVQGTNPNTGKEVDRWECCVSLLPLLLIENSRQQCGTSAAIESLRNETIKRKDLTNNILAAALKGQKSPPPNNFPSSEPQNRLLT